MATQTKSSPVTESIDAATERVVELNEKAVANGKKASAAILDTYEKAVDLVHRVLREGRRHHEGRLDRQRGRAPRPTSRATSRRRTRAPPASSSPEPLPGTRRSRRPRAATVSGPRPGPGADAPRTRCRSRAALDARGPSASGPPGSPPPPRARRPRRRRSPRRPPCSNSTSADSSGSRAIASSTFSDGSRNPRSICDRYGFEMPTRSASWRIESSCSSRWRRMNSPSGDVMRMDPSDALELRRAGQGLPRTPLSLRSGQRSREAATRSRWLRAAGRREPGVHDPGRLDVPGPVGFLLLEIHRATKSI